MSEALEAARTAERPRSSGLDVKVGPTGRFPDGKLSEHDNGEIAIAIGSEKGCVCLEFGVHIRSLGMTPEQALQMSECIAGHARRIIEARARK